MFLWTYDLNTPKIKELYEGKKVNWDAQSACGFRGGKCSSCGINSIL